MNLRLRSLLCAATLIIHVYQTLGYSAMPSLSVRIRNSSDGSSSRCFVSSGFSFQDENTSQLLVSVQKPLGIVLEQDGYGGPVVVSDVDQAGSAGKAGVQPGDVLLAVQNADMSKLPLEQVLAMIGQAPQVVNLRFMRVEGR